MYVLLTNLEQQVTHFTRGTIPFVAASFLLMGNKDVLFKQRH